MMLPNSLTLYHISCENHGNLCSVRTSYNNRHSTYYKHFSSQALIHSIFPIPQEERKPDQYIRHYFNKSYLSPLIPKKSLTSYDLKTQQYNLIGKFGVVKGLYQQQIKKTINNFRKLLEKYCDIPKEKFEELFSNYNLSELIRLAERLDEEIDEEKDRKKIPEAGEISYIIDMWNTPTLFTPEKGKGRGNLRFPKYGTWEVIRPGRKFEFFVLTKEELDNYLFEGRIFFFGKSIGGGFCPMKVTDISKTTAKLTDCTADCFPIEVWNAQETPQQIPETLKTIDLIDNTQRYSVIKGKFVGEAYTDNKNYLIVHDELLQALSGEQVLVNC